MLLLIVDRIFDLLCILLAGVMAYGIAGVVFSPVNVFIRYFMEGKKNGDE